MVQLFGVGREPRVCPIELGDVLFEAQGVRLGVVELALYTLAIGRCCFQEIVEMLGPFAAEVSL